MTNGDCYRNCALAVLANDNLLRAAQIYTMLCRGALRILPSSLLSRSGIAAATSCRAACRFQAEAAPAGEKKADAAPADDKVKLLETKITDLTAELKEAKQAHLYALADAENARRIGREDASKAKDFAISSFSKDMLDVADTLERAVESITKLDTELLQKHVPLQHTVTGIKMSHSVLLKNMSRNGIELMDAQPGHEFDPNKHDAIFTAPESDKIKAGQLTTVAKKGYMIRERVLRPAQVGVAEAAPK